MASNNDSYNKNQKIDIGWFAWQGTQCPRCNETLGPWHINDKNGEFVQEFWGCAQCGFGVMCESEHQPDCDSAADICISLIKPHQQDRRCTCGLGGYRNECPRTKTYNCGVLNCGNGKCVHTILDEQCPYCGEHMVEVTTTGHKFCSNNPVVCDYEIDVNDAITKEDNVTLNMRTMKCDKHGCDLECLGGESAHPANWYCTECDKEQNPSADNPKPLP